MSSVSDFQSAVNDAEEAYEFMISFAGQGIGREIPESDADDVREYLEQLRDGLEESVAAARSIPDEFDMDGADQLNTVLDDMEDEVEEAVSVLELLIAQDRITSQQVDNINGMSVFQSVVMKLFFLDEVTKHLD